MAPLRMHMFLDRSIDRVRVIALAFARARTRRQADAEPFVDERPHVTPNDAPTWFPMRSRRAPPAGLFMLTARLRGMAALDRVGMALGGDATLEYAPVDHLVLGVTALVPYVSLGTNIANGRVGLGALGEARLESDVGALGVYGGVITLARTGGPAAGVVGFRARYGPYDFIHFELHGSLLLSPQYGVLLGQAGGEVLLEAGAQWELMALRVDVAPELGWVRAEAGVRFFPDGLAGREAGHFGIEITAGAQALDFQESCGFSPCTRPGASAPQRDWMYGPVVGIGLLERFR